MRVTLLFNVPQLACVPKLSQLAHGGHPEVKGPLFGLPVFRRQGVDCARALTSACWSPEHMWLQAVGDGLVDRVVMAVRA